ncbi:MAG: hypothetical protein ACFCGT_20580 [Sandaracinaceae bacterium]
MSHWQHVLIGPARGLMLRALIAALALLAVGGCGGEPALIIIRMDELTLVEVETRPFTDNDLSSCRMHVWNLDRAVSTGPLTGDRVDVGTQTDTGLHTGFMQWFSAEDGGLPPIEVCAHRITGEITLGGVTYTFAGETVQPVLFDGSVSGVVATTECTFAAPEECGWEDDTGRSGDLELLIPE